MWLLSLLRRPRTRKILLDVLFLTFSVALALSFPAGKVSDLKDHYIAAGLNEPEMPDVLNIVTFCAYLKFSIVELKEWPLSKTPYLMFPKGATFGQSYDGLLLGIFTSSLWLFLPLPLAYNISLLLGLVLCGWACYLVAMHSWGRGWLATGIGLSAQCLPYLIQRIANHPNLFYVWTIPLSAYLLFKFQAKPTWKRTFVWALSFPLLFLSSSYNLIFGSLLHVSGSLVMLLEKRGRERLAMAKRVAAAWAIGAALVFLSGLPLFSHWGSNPKHDAQETARYSTTVVQYAMPFPASYAGEWKCFRRLQATIGTSWEGWAGGPIAFLAMMIAYFCMKKAPGPRWTLLLTACSAFLLSLGPYLNVFRFDPSGSGLKMPPYYLSRLSSAFRVIHAPGRAQMMVSFAALFAAGWLVYALKKRADAKKSRAAAAGSVALLAAAIAVNLIWSVRFHSLPISPKPEVSPFFRELGKRRGTGAILDVPISYYRFPIYTYCLFFHKRPLVTPVMFPFSYDGKAKAFIWSKPERLFFFDDNEEFVGDDTLEKILAPTFLRELAESGVEYVVVHPRLVKWAAKQSRSSPKTLEYYAQIENAWKDRLIYCDSGIRVYATGRGPTTRKPASVPPYPVGQK